MCTSLPLPTSPCKRVSRSAELGRPPPARVRPGRRERQQDCNVEIDWTRGGGGRAGRKQEERVGGIQMFGRPGRVVSKVPSRVSAGVTIPCLASRLRVSGFAAQGAVDGCFVLPMVCAYCSLLPWHAQHVPACWIRMTEGVGERPSTACALSMAHELGCYSMMES